MANKFNFQDVQTTYPPRQAGDYVGVLASHKIEPAKSGQPYCTLDFLEQDSTKHMFAGYSLQPQSLWAIKRDLIRMGVSVETMSQNDLDLDKVIEGLYGYSATLRYGDPRPATDGSDKVYDAFKEIVDPNKV